MNKMSKGDVVYNYTLGRIKYLQSINDMPLGRGMMANIRRGIGKHPGEIPEIWSIIFDNLPEELCGNKEASEAEMTIYTALTLYALHQQGKDVPMHMAGISFGRAAAKLVNNDDDKERILHRINLVVTAVSTQDLAYHLRSMVQLMKNKDIALDYARLAEDIYKFSYQEAANEVKLSWGRDFYRELNKKYTNEENENNG